MTTISRTSIEAALSPNVKIIKPNCPECGEVVENYFDHVDLDCTNLGRPNLYPNKDARLIAELLEAVEEAIDIIEHEYGSTHPMGDNLRRIYAKSGGKS